MAAEHRFEPGDAIRVKALTPPGHVRTPWFIRGKTGEIVQRLGVFGNPESLAYGGDGRPAMPLYRVRFDQRELWPDYRGPSHDEVIVDIFEHWLELRE